MSSMASQITGVPIAQWPVTGGFPSQRASNAENVSICWRRLTGNTYVTTQPWWRHQVEPFSTSLAFVGGIHRSRWIPRTKASDAELLYFLWSAPEKNDWVNNREAGDLRRHRGHYDVNVKALWLKQQVISTHSVSQIYTALN